MSLSTAARVRLSLIGAAIALQLMPTPLARLTGTSSGRGMADACEEAWAAEEAAMRALQAVMGEVAALQQEVAFVRQVAAVKHSVADEVAAMRGDVAVVWELAAVRKRDVQRLTGKVADLKRESWGGEGGGW
ncbi:unnamed protein product [Closterium sp. Naga37s-1]|nr:unnamed protein product [Closterium sp. Naga37s-1]